MNYKRIMICCSTGNQTVNLIPAIQKKIDLMVILTTERACKANWSKRLIPILKKYNIQPFPLDISQKKELDIDHLSQQMKNIIERYPNSEIYLNIGGGQKTFTMAFQKTRQMLEHKLDISIIYSDANSRSLIQFQKDHLDKFPISVELDLQDILSLYGFETSHREKKHLIKESIERSHDHDVAHIFLNSYLNNKDFREIFLALITPEKPFLPEEKNIKEIMRKAINTLYPKWIKSPIPLGTLSENIEKALWIQYKKMVQENLLITLESLKQNQIKKPLFSKQFSPKECTVLEKIFLDINGSISFENGYLYRSKVRYPERIGTIFEDLVISGVVTTLKNIPELQDGISGIYQNVETIRSGAKTVEAEYDIVIVTRFGTLIIFEAKSARYSGDLAKSKAYGAFRKNGPYGKAVMIGPVIDQLKDSDGNFYSEIPIVVQNQPLIAQNMGIEYVQLDKIEKFLKKELIIQ